MKSAVKEQAKKGFNSKGKACLLLICAWIYSISSWAAGVPDQARIIDKLESIMPQLQVKSIHTTPVKGLYQLEDVNGLMLLVTPDAKYVISGDLVSVSNTGVVNLTEKRRAQERKDDIKNLKDKDLVIFKAKGEEKGQVLVFTDTSCGYCRLFHSEVPQLNAMGITVKYAAWPRSGLQSPVGQEMVKVWCSKNRQEALDLAKNDEQVRIPKGNKCDQNIIRKEINLGDELGVKGTPAIFLTDGRQVGGYLPARQLAAVMGITPTY